MIKVGIAGCMGRMGSELVKAVCSNKNMIFIGGFEKHGNIFTCVGVLDPVPQPVVGVFP